MKPLRVCVCVCFFQSTIPGCLVCVFFQNILALLLGSLSSYAATSPVSEALLMLRSENDALPHYCFVLQNFFRTNLGDLRFYLSSH